jgi:uncharacterized phage-like protein YoqJ
LQVFPEAVEFGFGKGAEQRNQFLTEHSDDEIVICLQHKTMTVKFLNNRYNIFFSDKLCKMYLNTPEK